MYPAAWMVRWKVGKAVSRIECEFLPNFHSGLSTTRVRLQREQ
jgi:hypothetical protein